MSQWGSQDHQTHNVQQHSDPESLPEIWLGGLVAQKLLCQKCAWPTAHERQQVQRALWRSPGATCGSGLVNRVPNEGGCAQQPIQPSHPEGKPPGGGEGDIEDEECRYGKESCCAPWRPCSPLAGFGRAPGQQKLDALCALALGSKLNLEGDGPTDLRTAAAARPRRDMYKDGLTPLTGLNAAEATFVVPGCQCSFEAHRQRSPQGCADLTSLMRMLPAPRTTNACRKSLPAPALAARRSTATTMTYRNFPGSGLNKRPQPNLGLMSSRFQSSGLKACRVAGSARG